MVYGTGKRRSAGLLMGSEECSEPMFSADIVSAVTLGRRAALVCGPIGVESEPKL